MLKLSVTFSFALTHYAYATFVISVPSNLSGAGVAKAIKVYLAANPVTVNNQQHDLTLLASYVIMIDEGGDQYSSKENIMFDNDQNTIHGTDIHFKVIK